MCACAMNRRQGNKSLPSSSSSSPFLLVIYIYCAERIVREVSFDCERLQQQQQQHTTADVSNRHDLQLPYTQQQQHQHSTAAAAAAAAAIDPIANEASTRHGQQTARLN